MADAATEKVMPTFTAFNFRVAFRPGSRSRYERRLCRRDGLEMNMVPKTIRERGKQDPPHPSTAAPVMGSLHRNAARPLLLKIVVLVRAGQQPGQAQHPRHWRSGDASRETVLLNKFVALEAAVPIKVKAPALNAKDGPGRRRRNVIRL